MITGVGHDKIATSTLRSAPADGRSSTFASTLEAITASNNSFTISRSSQARESDRAATESAEAKRLDEAVAAFKKELSMTPAERVRRDVLKSMDLTEESIEALPPKERIEVEQKVAMEVARRMKVMQGGNSGGLRATGAALGA